MWHELLTGSRYAANTSHVVYLYSKTWVVRSVKMDNPNNLCVKCNKEVRQRQQTIECESCMRWQHRVCGTGISQDMYRRVTKGLEQLSWSCEPCSSIDMQVNSTALENSARLASLEWSSITDEIVEDMVEEETRTGEEMEDFSKTTYIVEPATPISMDDSTVTIDSPVGQILPERTFEIPNRDFEHPPQIRDQ